MPREKNTAYKFVSMFIAFVIFLGASVFIIGNATLVAEACCLEEKTHSESSLSAEQRLRPTREEIKEMEENAEKIKDDKWARPIVIILCVLIFILGLLMLLYPDFFIELSFFKYNQRNYWLGRGYTLNPTKAVRIICRIFGIFFMLLPLISYILVYIIL